MPTRFWKTVVTVVTAIALAGCSIPQALTSTPGTVTGNGSATVNVPAGTGAVKSYACVVDGVAQPIAAGVLFGLGPWGALAAALDANIVHPLVVQWCNAKGATAVVLSATGTFTAAPAATK